MLRIQHVVLLAAAVLGSIGEVQAAPLTIGDRPPVLAVETWLKGEPRPLPEQGKIYVVEFWATWCGPCLANVPHLSAIQSRYAKQGVVVVGATSRDAWGNTEAAVRSFVTKKGSAIGYRIAWLPVSAGKESGIHRNPWFTLAGIESLPTAFLVARDGRIAFIGDPMQLDEVLPAVIAGSFDYAKARAAFAARLAAKAKMAALDAAVKRSDRAAALSIARDVAAGGDDDAHLLAWLSGVVAGSPWKTEQAFVDVAFNTSSRAVALTHRRAPGALDTLATAWFLRGNVAKAVESEAEAVALSEGAMREAQTRKLEQYRAALKR